MGSDFDLARWRLRGTDETYYIPDFVSRDEEEYLIRKIVGSPRHKWKRLANRRFTGGEIINNNILVTSDIPGWLNQSPDIIKRLSNTGAYANSAHGAPNHVILNEYLPGQGIMPHQDGPTYHPLVGTISLGSHAVFHYYEYKENAQLPEPSQTLNDSGRGRAVNPEPVLSVLLEPRSLIITTSRLYTNHLHGIDPLEEDSFSLPLATDAIGQGSSGHYKIANVDLLQGSEALEAVRGGGSLARHTRYSLTCRDVEKIANAKFLGKR
ncbi:hypothetical protein GLOTRDRAFT_116081 [Gloeophyllum trabeum ATCC 11539]|uniref:Fe2OG dioxygenase domain-containing protein n=1 Tax=Gloeophyllum trabeum (strain ATCC 11539 / FP-39264 / Madison 617) TaxID=670483 RepID=S7RNC4_GLOTA|nr:uncharacterized protein GLOTRDRAFT_116081 [Gloeophyllum trabeum ATCC 11539]EPQ55965.1 hypothetical protein GLOTRDRAFT_116081 [Gloeophyllum trabeum ATCC 11539]